MRTATKQNRYQINLTSETHTFRAYVKAYNHRNAIRMAKSLATRKGFGTGASNVIIVDWDLA